MYNCSLIYKLLNIYLVRHACHKSRKKAHNRQADVVGLVSIFVVCLFFFSLVRFGSFLLNSIVYNSKHKLENITHKQNIHMGCGGRMFIYMFSSFGVGWVLDAFFF